MTTSPHTTLPSAMRHTPPPLTRAEWGARGRNLLAVVAGGFALAQLALVQPEMGLGWDETVYVSQVSSHAPAAFFSAPRARGISLLVAPVASWSSSTPLLRIYLAVLAGLGLFLALRSWRGLFPARVLGLAGALFATLWVTMFYGPQAMPNFWVAIGALAAVGNFLRAQADRLDRAAVWGLAASAALMALMRPTDAVWVSLPLFAALACVRRWRRPALWTALGIGLAAGAAPWIVEAYVSYGGPAQTACRRLRDPGRPRVEHRRRRPTAQPGRTDPVPPLHRSRTGIGGDGMVARPAPARHACSSRRDQVPANGPRTRALACATTAALPYLFLIGYAAPRFLLPAYALLAIPVAVALLHLLTVPGLRWRRVVVPLLTMGLVAHLAAQYIVLKGAVDRTTASHHDWTRTADALHRLGLRPPCLLTGHQALPIAFYTGCASAQVSGPNANSTAGIVPAAPRIPVATLTAPGAATAVLRLHLAAVPDVRRVRLRHARRTGSAAEHVAADVGFVGRGVISGRGRDPRWGWPGLPGRPRCGGRFRCGRSQGRVRG